ncbi:dicarboxylate/amino acid:cation symporter [Terriglobus saanensis]|uniref:Sodium:dicarboxylate symporter n=1 Tax=Terriglobus saanensis (strain ATCC BAA-1853 / DSM 23119 / SP1PR4) TaxID=401053 RepID=E8UXN4_TERSS|nr:cation:dicarboxylase symporter family transporter [Terriglobus saanensis]ADV81978.1 sodium:dicarboxylate symporter [Terriglobus saanensis SP1PR4]
MVSRRFELSLLAIAVVLLAAGSALGILAVPHSLVFRLGVASRVASVLLLVLWAVNRRKLTPWIAVAMVAGVELGLDAPAAALQIHFLSDIFLRLVKTIAAPLILMTIISGVAGHGDLKGVGRMAFKSLIYFEVITTLALVIGLCAINISKAGVGMNVPEDPASSAALNSAAPIHWQDFLVHVFPENIAKSIADGQVLQVSIFGLIFGIALALTPLDKRTPVLRLTESISEVMFRFTNIVMYFAPFGVGAAIAYTIARMGPGILIHLGKLLLTLYAALGVFGVCVLLPVALLARIPVRRFLKHVSGPAAIAFATAASEAALPRVMEEMEAFGVPRRIVAFVIPAGYSFNLEGSTLYLAMAMGFVAQAAGIQLTLGQQVFMMGTLMLSSKGVAGVPRAVLVVLMSTAATIHLPPEPILILLGVDALMDMGRTMISVVGNSLATAVIARWEGELNLEAPSLAIREAMAE